MSKNKQLTGIKDYYNKEIFEGDIVKIIYKDVDGEEVKEYEYEGEVVWNNKTLSFKCKLFNFKEYQSYKIDKMITREQLDIIKNNNKKLEKKYGKNRY